MKLIYENTKFGKRAYYQIEYSDLRVQRAKKARLQKRAIATDLAVNMFSSIMDGNSGGSFYLNGTPMSEDGKFFVGGAKGKRNEHAKEYRLDLDQINDYEDLDDAFHAMVDQIREKEILGEVAIGWWWSDRQRDIVCIDVSNVVTSYEQAGYLAFVQRDEETFYQGATRFNDAGEPIDYAYIDAKTWFAEMGYDFSDDGKEQARKELSPKYGSSSSSFADWKNINASARDEKDGLVLSEEQENRLYRSRWAKLDDPSDFRVARSEELDQLAKDVW